MKKVLAFFGSLLIAITVFAQDPFDSDTIIYKLNRDSSWDILTAKVYRNVTPQNKTNFQKEVIKRRLNQFAELERQVVEQKNKLKADSLALERELQNNLEIFERDMNPLVGVWKLTIGDKSDEITVDSIGAFTSKKSGFGTLIVLAEGAKKIRIVLGDNKINLTRTNDRLFENEKLRVKLKRVEEGEKKR